jgi:long-chain fatty acid transport protein
VDPTTGKPFTSANPPPDCSALLTPPPPNYHDTVTPHVGVERVLAPAPRVDMRLRGGLFFEPSPAPTQSSLSNLYDNHRLAFTLGYGLEVGPRVARVALDFFAQAQALIPRDNIKEADVPASNPGAPRVTTSGFIGAFGTTLGVKF